MHTFWALALYALWRRMMLRPRSLLDDRVSTRAHRDRHLLTHARRLPPSSWACRSRTCCGSTAINCGRSPSSSRSLHRAPAAADASLPATAPPRPRSAPALVALALSRALTFATPLGAGSSWGPLRPPASLSLFREHVAEFQRIWRMPDELGLAIFTGAPAAWALWRARRRVDPFDVSLWLLSLALVLSAVRGLMFFGVVSVAVFQRPWARCREAGERFRCPGVGPAAQRGLAAVGFALTTLLAGNAVYHRWIHAPRHARGHATRARPQHRRLGRVDDGVPGARRRRAATS